MKKIGILSMQRIENYGSFLQAYGLKRMIEDLGYIVTFVDYMVEPVVSANKKECKIRIECAVNRIKNSYLCIDLKKIYRKIKRRDEEDLNEYEMLVKRYREEFLPILGIPEKYSYRTKVDTLVIGSDEVFNCLQDNPAVGYSKELFGYRNRANKVITYAASFGNTTFERLEEYGKSNEIGNMLKKIDMISVRDRNSVSVVNKLTGTKPLYHMDPVLMFDFSDVIDSSCVKIEDYIIVYAYAGRISKNEAQIIRKFAKEKKKRLISISGYQDFCDEHLTLSPFEVLAYFKNADYIITDTFHGSIFSIINNKNFVTIIRKTVNDSYGNEEKLSDLLERLHLSDREIKKIEEINVKFSIPIDYSITNEIIQNERKRTRDYLRENL